MIDPTIPQTLRDLVKKELERDERIEWIGMPKVAYFTPGSTVTVLFGIPWTAFAIFWTVTAAWGTSNMKDGPGLFSLFPLFGLPFILIGIGMLSSPFWAYWRASKTVYAISDRRVITIEGGWSKTIRSYASDNLKDVFRKEKKDGSGDIILSQRIWRDSDGDRQLESFGLLRIANVKDVEARIKKLAQQAKTDSQKEKEIQE